MSLLSHRIESVDHIVPNGVRASILSSGLGALDQVRVSMISLDHGQLVLGNTKCSPEKALLRHDQVANKLREKRGTDLVTPNLSLFVESLGFEELLHSLLQTKESSDPAENTNGVTRASGVVETMTAAVLEDVDVLEPVLECATRKMRRELCDKKLTELGVLAVTKDLPEILIGEGSI